MSETILPEGGFFRGLTSFRLTDANQQDVIIGLPDWVNKILQVLTYVGFPIWFWIATYQRLKEKEV
jgi:hypothetical protein